MGWQQFNIHRNAEFALYACAQRMDDLLSPLFSTDPALDLQNNSGAVSVLFRDEGNGIT